MLSEHDAGSGKQRNCQELVLISPSPSPASFPTSPLESTKEAVAAGGTPRKQSRHTASGHSSGTKCAWRTVSAGVHAGFFLSEYNTELRETTPTTPTTRRKVIPNPVEKNLKSVSTQLNSCPCSSKIVFAFNLFIGWSL